MPHTIILHVQNEEAIYGEVDELPTLTDTMIRLMNPRRADGKDLNYLQEGVVSALWPLHRINFIEITSMKEEEEIIGFVRE